MKADPPPIFFSKTPAVLVNVDGDPIWSPIKGNDLQYAVNTNWDLFQHTPTKTLYLRATDTWLKAAALQGPWTYAGPLPDSFYKLPNDPNWKDAKGGVAGQKLAPADAPRVFTTTTPAELILLKGEPAYSPVAGTAGLLWVSNTESDLFRVNRSGPVYFLTSGRWFSAPDFGGPWTFASPSLPADFKKIPLEHARSRVLASVPGTPEAAEAVLLAQIPQTATVGKDLKAPEVAYQGAPEFQPIEKTTRPARRQHRQGHHQGRRSVLHVLPGRLVHVEERDRPMGGHRRRAQGHLHDPGQLSVVQRDLRHRQSRFANHGCVRRRRRLIPA